MNHDQVLFLLLAIVAIDFIWERVLHYLDDKSNQQALPAELADIYEATRYQKAMDYQRTTNRFGLLSSGLSFVISFALLATGAYGWLDAETRFALPNELFASFAFFGILAVGSELVGLPFTLYATFVIEERFGFNKTTVRTFIVDKLKGYLLALLLGAPLFAVFLYLIWSMGSGFWLYFWAVAVVFLVLANLLYTSLILPLFNKLSPLEAGDLKTAIEAYAAKVKFPLSNIYVIDGSKRSAKSNAFFSGFGKRKKVVLYDTLIDQHSTEELVAIIAHEIGHYKKRHVYLGFGQSVLQIGLMLFVLGQMVTNSQVSFAMGGHTTSMSLNLLAFGILYSPISHAIALLSNYLSRRHEFAADRWASLTYSGAALKSALKKLSAHNLSALLPHRLMVIFHYSHPPLKQRLEAISANAETNSYKTDSEAI